MRQREFKGEITVFLSLIFVLILSLVGALLQSASLHTRASMKRTETALALECVFAEYHKGLWEQYGILARELDGERELTSRLEFYGAGNMEVSQRKVRYLTDGNGEAFYEQAIRAMGIEPDFKVTDSDESVQEQEEKSEQELEEILAQEGQEMPKEDNPIQSVKELKKSNLLALVHKNPEKLSTKTIEVDTLASHRELKRGSGFSDKKVSTGVKERAMFMAYLVKHFQHYSEEETERLLEYEAEYLLSGTGSDQKNLEKVAKKIINMRVAVNYAYLLADCVKQAEAEAMAATLSSLLTVPGATMIVKQVLLFSWAYGESVVDLRVLFQGKKIPVVKTEDTWQLQLSNLAKFGTDDEVAAEYDGSKGLDYEGYLKILLATQDQEMLCMRALDVMEWNLDIKADACMTATEIECNHRVPRVGMDTFHSRYQYQ